MADAIIAISSAVEDWLISQIKLSSWKVRKIYYGIDFKRFQTDETARSNLSHELGIEKDKFLIGTVGRLSIEKGHPYLIQSLSQVKREIPQTHLLLVGHEDEGLRNELENLIDKLHLRENVTLAGYRDDIPAVMHAIDVFALPSLSEGLGLVLLEAMAAGKPIVATRVGAIPEIVVEGKTAILVPPADSNCLAEAIVNMLNQPLQAKKMGEEGKTYVATHFTIESMVKRTITTYEKRTQIEVGCIKKKVT
jgi:glycosyltransferase involved in cell wall biosynthesis